MFKLLLILFLTILLSISTQYQSSDAAVLSIDLGSEWMKVSVVNLKPGQIPISIAINEMSKRKSPALVAFHDSNRLIGEEAAGITARYPQKVYSQLRDFIGKTASYVKELSNSYYLPFDFVEDKRGQIAIKVDDGDNNSVYSVEELVAMVLGYGKNLAEFHAKTIVKDGVITVPVYFGQAERRGVMQAAELAGINVLALLNEHCGAALQYGIDKDFSNQSRYVVFYDMGTSNTYAALVYFSAYNTKDFGKTVSANQFQVKDVRWNAKLGGQDMEMVLVEYFADEFNKQVGNGVDVRKFPKAMAKLKKQVKRTKEILSANTMAPISVESLYDDRDFRSTITREKFEELCGDLWDKALDPVKEVLSNSGLKVDDIYAIELIGGATRVPKLQAKLQEFLGRKELDKHIDADEAIVLGASLHAANLSDGIKLNRKLGMIDGSPYGFSMQLNGPGLSDEDSAKQLLVPQMKKLPSKTFRSIIHDKDFEVSLYYQDSNVLPPGISSDKFSEYAVSGLSDVSEKYSSRNLSSPIKATLHFSLSRSGILSLTKADAVIEISEWVEVPKKNLTVDNSTNATPNVSVEATTETSSEGIPENVTVDGENSSTPKSGEVEEKAVEMEKKLKKRTFRVNLKVAEKTIGPGSPLSEEAFAEAKLRLSALDKKDAERRKTAELKNNLESYVYATREKIDISSEIEKISTEQERQSFIEKLDEVQEWLYTDGEDALASKFQERLDSLKAIGDPIFFRLSEITARPEASAHARSYLGEIQQIISSWEKNKPWLPKGKIDEVVKDADKLKKWLEEKEAEQKKMSGFSKPAFTSDDVYDKVGDLQDKVSRINRIPKPKPKVEKAPKNETEGEGDKANKSKSDSSSKENNTSQNDEQDSSPTSPDEKEERDADSHDEL